MEETGLVVVKEWFGSGLEDKRTKRQEVIHEVNQYIGEQKAAQFIKKH